VMFKFLLKCLLDDIEAVFRSYYGALLAHPRDFVRRFAAETFAFLLRKLPQAKFEKVLTIITSLHAEAEDLQLSKTVVVSTSDSPDGDDADDQTEVTEPLPALDVQSERFCDGLAWTLFYVAKGVQQRFHSKLSWVCEHTLRMPLHTHKYGHTHTHTRTYTCTCPHTCVHTHTHTQTHTQAHTRARAKEYTHTRTHTHTHTRTYTHTHTHTHTHTRIGAAPVPGLSGTVA
jgi:hypothetical protein